MKTNEFLKPTEHSVENSFSDALLQLFRTEAISVKGEVDDS